MKIDTNWRDIPAMVNDDGVVREYEAMERWVVDVYEKLGYGVALEVGSFEGRSTAILTQCFIVFAIDLWGIGYKQGKAGKVKTYGNIGQFTFPTFMKNMTDRNLVNWSYNENALDRIYPICGTSLILEHIPYLSAKFAFVDAEHTYPSAYYDLCRCAKHIEIGGIIGLHDCARPSWGWGDCLRSENDPWADNYRSFQEFMENHSEFKIVEHCEGIIFVRRIK